MSETTEKTILKTTFLFGFVKIFQILAGIIKNKVVAVLLGPEGVGIISIFLNSTAFIQNGAGLGISQSAVRDISDANGSGDKERFSLIISVTNKVILFTCILGCFITVVSSSLLSEITFGDKSYTIAYVWLGMVVGLNILTEGQLAILKGMRQMRALAKASMFGSLVGLLTAVPMYYILGKSGIVPSLIITAVSSVVFSFFFVSKIKYNRIKLNLYDVKKQALPMVKMGLALMLVGFLGLAFDLLVSTYIRAYSGLSVVGYYKAGTNVISSYFGIVLTAMTTDYYPRISAAFRDNEKIQEDLNQQSHVGLILIFPIAVLFVFLSPLIMQILYSKDFIKTIEFTDYAIIGTIIVVCSNSMGMILIAKQEAKIFTTFIILHRSFFIMVYFLLFNLYSLTGLGIAYFIDSSLQFIILSLLINIKYGIKLKKIIIIQLFIFILVTLVTIWVRNINGFTIRYISGGVILLCSFLYSYVYIKRTMNINVLQYLKNKRNK